MIDTDPELAPKMKNEDLQVIQLEADYDSKRIESKQNPLENQENQMSKIKEIQPGS